MCLDHLFSYQSTLKRKEEESLNNLCCCVDKMKATQPQSSASQFRRSSVLFGFLRFMTQGGYSLSGNTDIYYCYTGVHACCIYYQYKGHALRNRYEFIKCSSYELCI